MNSTKNQVKYWTYGSKRKPALLFIHGFTGSHEGFQYIIPKLEESYYIIVPDLPGFGESSLSLDEFTIDSLAKKLNDFTQNLPLKKPYLISHSMGGLVAASMLSQDPDLYQTKTLFISPVSEKVSLLDSRKVGAVLGALQYRIGRNGNKFGHKLVTSKLISRIATSFMTTTQNKHLKSAIVRHHFDNLENISSIDFYYQLHVDINKKGARDYADKLRSFNVQIISGDKDNVTPLAGVQRFTKAVGGKLTVVRGVGHLMHYERPERIASKIKSFIS